MSPCTPRVEKCGGASPRAQIRAAARMRKLRGRPKLIPRCAFGCVAQVQEYAALRAPPKFPRYVSIRRHSAETVLARVFRIYARQRMRDRTMSGVDETFDALTEVQRVKAFRKECRRKRYRKSRLDRYRSELVSMRLIGASLADLAEWLRLCQRLKVSRSSIDRYLKKLPEFAGAATQVQREVS